MEEDRVIHQKDVEDFLFTQLVKAGLAPQAGDLEIISSIFFEFLIEIGIMSEDGYDDSE